MRAVNDDFSRTVIGLAIDVHRELGPGLLESAYEECLAYELQQASIRFLRQEPVPIAYKGLCWTAATVWICWSKIGW